MRPMIEALKGDVRMKINYLQYFILAVISALVGVAAAGVEIWH
jgi:hypothetical protein